MLLKHPLSVPLIEKMDLRSDTHATTNPDR